MRPRLLPQRAHERGRPRLPPAFDAFAKGSGERLAYVDQPGPTYGYAEGVIDKVEVIKRRASGIANVGGFGHRVLLAWTDRPKFQLTFDNTHPILLDRA